MGSRDHPLLVDDYAPALEVVVEEERRLPWPFSQVSGLTIGDERHGLCEWLVGRQTAPWIGKNNEWMNWVSEWMNENKWEGEWMNEGICEWIKINEGEWMNEGISEWMKINEGVNEWMRELVNEWK